MTPPNTACISCDAQLHFCQARTFVEGVPLCFDCAEEVPCFYIREKRDSVRIVRDVIRPLTPEEQLEALPWSAMIAPPEIQETCEVTQIGANICCDCGNRMGPRNGKMCSGCYGKRDMRIRERLRAEYGVTA